MLSGAQEAGHAQLANSKIIEKRVQSEVDHIVRLKKWLSSYHRNTLCRSPTQSGDLSEFTSGGNYAHYCRACCRHGLMATGG